MALFSLFEVSLASKLAFGWYQPLPSFIAPLLFSVYNYTYLMVTRMFIRYSDCYFMYQYSSNSNTFSHTGGKQSALVRRMV